MSRIQRKLNSASGQFPIGTPGFRRHRNRVATGGQELSGDEYTVPLDYSSEESEMESASLTNKPLSPSAPASSWRSKLTIPLVIVVVGCVLGRTVAGAAAFATMIMLITVGGLGAGFLVYLLFKLITRIARSSHTT